MSSRRIRTIILSITLLSILPSTWNAVDEFWMLHTWTGVATIVLIWFVAPCLNALVGLFTKRQLKVYLSLVLSILFVAFFTMYALNGSTAGRTTGPENSGHMHLIFVPFFSLLLWAATLSLTTIVDQAIKRREARWHSTT